MSLDLNIANIRKDYSLESLSEAEVAGSPMQQFDKWWSEALKSEIVELNAMTLATSGNNGKPDARIVLLKGFSEKGFMFFTNYQSRKAKELSENPFACLVIFWKELERQVRIEGAISKVSETESNEYFSQRPVKSQISAWSSPQSEVVENRALLENNVKKYELKFADGNIPRPPHWGGYILSPAVIEFWQGRRNRLHDRIRYSSDGGNWVIERLAP